MTNTARARLTPPQGRGSGSRRWPILAAVLVAVVAVAALYAVFRAGDHHNGTAAGVDQYQVGHPGPGQAAPPFTLPAAQGGTVSLSDFRGKTVLLYFHEGLGCQPCWDQIRDLEKDTPQLRAAGIDDVVTITTGTPDLLAQKLSDDHLHTTTLADTDLTVSRAYTANQYGMMGQDRDGHTFVLVGPDGKIDWRADYGGAPNYTMYVPPNQLLADMKVGRVS